jgi:hypothetical protein
MIRFKKYINETKEIADVFQNAKVIAKYIKSDAYKKRYETALDELSTAAKNKEIFNARFAEYKNHISSGLEYGYKDFFETIKNELIKNKVETLDLWSLYGLSDIKKLDKIYSDMKPRNQSAINFFTAIRDLPAAMKNMKSYVKSGRAPKPIKPGQFIKPIASHEAEKLATKFMTDATNTFKQNLTRDITTRYTTAFNKIKNITSITDLPKDSASIDLASQIFISRGFGKNKILELKNTADNILKTLIQDAINSIIDGFIYKNSSKLALILQKKDQPKSHNIIRTNISNGKVENLMSFEFNDGSKFDMESTVIYKTSAQGKFFMQYPTRFKNVKLSDGTSMKMPSEEKMISQF